MKKLPSFLHFLKCFFSQEVCSLAKSFSWGRYVDIGVNLIKWGFTKQMPMDSSNKIMQCATAAKLIKEQSIYLQTNILVTSSESTRPR